MYGAAQPASAPEQLEREASRFLLEKDALQRAVREHFGAFPIQHHPLGFHPCCGAADVTGSDGDMPPSPSSRLLQHFNA